MARESVKVVEGEVTLRPWSAGDAGELVRLGDDREIWLNLRDRFPHPFTEPAAHLWLADFIDERPPVMSFAILVRRELAGGVRLRRRDDAHHICADLTFWVGRPFSGRGIALEAVRAATAYAFDTLGLERVQAFVFDWNPAAARVLEKAGYALEGRLRHYVQKDGRLGDALLYARLRSEPAK
ncbi:MAG TPA: GNAT family protein [Anaeromyxobacteraceae bacterium]